MEMFQRFLKQPPSGYPSDDHTRTRLNGAIEEVVHEPPATVRAALTQKLPQLRRKLESEFKTVEDLPAQQRDLRALLLRVLLRRRELCQLRRAVAFQLDELVQLVR